MPWIKGQSGNPLGRAVEKPWTDAIKRKLAQLEIKDGEKVICKKGEALAKIAETVITRAIVGDKDAWREIGDRMEGKPPQAIVGPDNGPIQVMETPWLPVRSR